MTGQGRSTLVAAASLGLAALPLASVFSGVIWALAVAVTLTVVASAGATARALGRGQGLQTLAMGVGLILLLTLSFNGGTAIAFIIPTPGTFGHWITLAGSGVTDIVFLAPPVDADGGILFLTMFGIGLVAILHDMFVVGLRTPALSGLTLLTIYLVPVSVSPDATSWFWFILPAAAYLWVLADDNLRRLARFGHRFTGTGKLVAERYPSPLAATAQVTSVVFIATALVFLAIVPVNTSGLLDRVASGGSGDGSGDGFPSSGRIDPWARLAGSLRMPDPEDWLRIRTDNAAPPYLRMHVADLLTTRSGFGPTEPVEYDDLSSLESSGGEVFRAEVDNLKMTDVVLPVYGRPVGFENLDDRWAIDADTRVIFGRDTDMSNVESYAFDYVAPSFSADDLDQAPPLDPDDLTYLRNTAIPDSTPEALYDFIDEAIGDAATDYEKVRALLDYFRPANGFRYDVDTVNGGSGSDIVDFLENQAGFCQQYAGAMAWMLRAEGVPARVIIGLTRGTQRDGAWIVTTQNAHAWVEVYFSGHGWVPFDPTPSSGVTGSVFFPWASDTSTTEDAGQTRDEPGQRDEPGLGDNDANLPENDLGDAAEVPDAAAPPPDESTLGPYLIWSGVGGAILLALLAPAAWRLAQRRARLGARGSAAAAWDETLALAADYRIPVEESLTPRQTAARLGEAAPPAHGAATALAHAVEQHRYAAPGSAAAAPLPGAVRELRRELDRRAPASWRIRARLLPPSTGSQAGALRRRAATAIAGTRDRLRPQRRSKPRRDRAVTGGS